MPGYAAGFARIIHGNQQVFLFQQETNVTGRASIAVQIERARFSYPWGISAQIYFTDATGKPADPGAYEIDIQTSDIDLDGQYCTINAINGTLNASFATRLELPSFYAKFVRAYVKTLTNAVYVSVLVTR